MHRLFSALAVGLLVLGSGPALADDDDDDDEDQFLIGFSEGIDPLDGSTVQMSITDDDQDGVFDFIYREGFFTSCFTAQNTKGRGVVIGTGILVEKGVMEVVADQTCFDDGNQAELEFEVFNIIRAALKGDNLTILQDPFPSIILHRTGD